MIAMDRGGLTPLTSLTPLTPLTPLAGYGNAGLSTPGAFVMAGNPWSGVINTPGIGGLNMFQFQGG